MCRDLSSWEQDEALGMPSYHHHQYHAHLIYVSITTQMDHHALKQTLKPKIEIFGQPLEFGLLGLRKLFCDDLRASKIFV